MCLKQASITYVKSRFDSSCFSPLGNVPQNPAGRLRLRSWCALALVAGLLIFQQVLLQPALIRLQTDAPVINVAGRQRMLSQKLSKTVLALQTSQTADARRNRRAELSAVVGEWTRAHRGLQQGDPVLQLPGENSPEIRAAFDRLEPHFLAMVTAVQKLLPAEDPGAELSVAQRAAIESVMQHEDAFLQQMHTLVGLYAVNARSHVGQLEMLGWGIVATILAILLAGQWLIVRPAVDFFGNRFVSSEAEYRRLVESMSEGLVVHDAQGSIQFANRRFCEIVGLSAKSLLGDLASRFVVAADRGRYSQLIVATGGPSEPVELGWRGLDGQRTDTMASTQPLFDDHGVLQGFLLVVTDITARKQAEQRSRELLEQLAHADRLKSMGELAAGLAHEINQPLAAIANYAEGCLTVLRTDAPAVETLQTPLQRILSAALRGGEIVRRSRRFAQRRPHEVQVESLNDLVCDVELLCRPEAQRRDVVIELHLAADLPPIPVDGIQVQQVLTNLVQNAFAALDSTLPQLRHLQISTEFTTPEFVTVSVCDSGIGLSGASASRVFEPFFTTRSDGLGLGLAIVRNIIEAHGGTIAARNNRDCGATFCFTLPTQSPLAGVTQTADREESVHA
ncbi:MAG: ATP-binding protein [Planctomycetota bacterium]